MKFNTKEKDMFLVYHRKKEAPDLVVENSLASMEDQLRLEDYSRGASFPSAEFPSITDDSQHDADVARVMHFAYETAWSDDPDFLKSPEIARHDVIHRDCPKNLYYMAVDQHRDRALINLYRYHGKPEFRATINPELPWLLTLNYGMTP